MDDNLEVITENNSDQRFQPAREFIRKNNWEISKRIILYYPLIKMVDAVDFASKNLAINGENLLDINELFLKPVWDQTYMNLGIATIVSLLTYSVLHNINNHSDKTEKVISEWKRTVKGKAKSARDKMMINAASVLGAVATTFPVDVAQVSLDPSKDLNIPIYLLNLGMRFICFNYILNYATYLKKPRLNSFFNIVGDAIPGLYHGLRKDTPKLLDRTTNIADNFNPGMRLIRSSMAGDLIKLERYEDAMELYLADVENLDAMEKPGLVDRFIEYIAPKIGAAIESEEKISKVFRYLPKKPGNFLESLEAIASESESLDIKLLYGVSFNKLHPGEDRLKEQLWEELMTIILNRPDTEFRHFGDSANTVAEYAPDRFVGSVFLLKQGSDTGEDVRKTYESRKLVENHDRFGVPEPLCCIRGKYAFRRINGILLNDSLDENTFYDVADYLALIHHGMKSDKPKIDLFGYFNKRLTNKDLNLPDELNSRIMANYHPLIDSLDDAVYVFNKDAHPEQWIIAENGVIEALDWEDKGLVPIQFDLVNLLEYGLYLNFDQKKDIINHYIDEYNVLKGEDGISDRESFMIGYYNAVVHRAISFCSAWSSADRPSMHGKREIVVDNAIHAIAMIELDHNRHYARYKHNYDNLKEALHEMLSIVQSKHSC